MPVTYFRLVLGFRNRWSSGEFTGRLILSLACGSIHLCLFLLLGVHKFPEVECPKMDGHLVHREIIKLSVMNQIEDAFVETDFILIR